MTAPERIYIAKCIRSGWVQRHAAALDVQHEYILHTRAALAASPLVQEIVAEAVQWQPIETAPKDGSLILAASPNATNMLGFLSSTGRVLTRLGGIQ